MTERDAFLVAIDEKPEDLSLRWVFADWLEEHGNDGDYDLAQWYRSHTKERYDEAKDWLTNFSSQCGPKCTFGYGPDDMDREEPITYEDVVRAGRDAIDNDDYFVQIGTEGARTLMWSGTTRQDFWCHWQVVTGIRVTEEQQKHYVFSCSC